MNPVPTAFAWLTHEEFRQLSTEAKVTYLAEAIDALSAERGSIFIGQGGQLRPKPTLQ